MNTSQFGVEARNIFKPLSIEDLFQQIPLPFVIMEESLDDLCNIGRIHQQQTVPQNYTKRETSNTSSPVSSLTSSPMSIDEDQLKMFPFVQRNYVRRKVS